MTTWYRAATYENIEGTFSGTGGLHVAGRWHHLGNKVVYCSESIALCTLEWLTNNGLPVSGFEYYRFSIEVPDGFIKKFEKSELPKGWNAIPSTDITRDFSEAMLFRSKKLLAIAIPSVIVPEEYNLVINTAHNKFSEITNTIKVLGQHIAPKR